MKNILVTGGAGFIGSNLCNELSKNLQNKVYSLDNYFTGSEENHVENVKYIRGNTIDIEDLIDIDIDIVFHLGEYSRVEQSFNDIEKLWEYNANGTFAVIQFCLKNESKLIYAGSSTKFGDNGVGVDQSPYAWTKNKNTELIINFGNWFKLNFCIVYFYNAYGPNEISKGSYATLIAIFKEKFLNNKPLTVVRPGTQLRNFTHVKDIVRALVLIGEKGNGDGFGIGHPDSYSVLDVAKMFGSKIKYLNERRGNRMNAELVTKKTTSLGWEPKHDIKDYILKIINNG
tara:strand:+ start:7115 stop:7972 length:858 start_codon:yes stop_codon:yes gene_type:complete